MPGFTFDGVSMDGFRGLRRLRLENLGLLNVLVGENNCGKTSVLEAMSILCDAWNPYEWLSMAYRRDFGGLDENRIQSLRWCFRQQGDLRDPEAMFESECELSAVGSAPMRRLIAKYRDIAGEPDLKQLENVARIRGWSDDRLYRYLQSRPWRGAEIAHIVEGAAEPQQRTLFDDANANSIKPLTVQIWEGLPVLKRPRRHRPRIESETLTPYSYQIGRQQVQYQSEFALNDRRELVLDLVRGFDPDIQDVQVASLWGERPAVYLRHRILGPAPLSIFGDALRRAVLLASTIPVLGRGGVLLIDEIETGIHVSALQRVFSWLIAMARRFQMQVIATTHSLESLDAIVQAAGDSIDDVVAYHLTQTPKETAVKRWSGELLLRLRRERGLEVR